VWQPPSIKVPEVLSVDADAPSDSAPSLQLELLGRGGGGRGSSMRLRGKGVRRQSQVPLRLITSDGASPSADEAGGVTAAHGCDSYGNVPMGSHGHSGGADEGSVRGTATDEPKHSVRASLANAPPGIAAIHSAPVIIDRVRHLPPSPSTDRAPAFLFSMLALLPHSFEGLSFLRGPVQPENDDKEPPSDVEVCL
jgi:hypothetical protein